MPLHGASRQVGAGGASLQPYLTGLWHLPGLTKACSLRGWWLLFNLLRKERERHGLLVHTFIHSLADSWCFPDFFERGRGKHWCESALVRRLLQGAPCHEACDLGMCPLGMEPATFWCTGCSTKSYSGQGCRLIRTATWMCQDITRTSRSTGWRRALTKRASGRPGLLPGLCATGIMKRPLPLGSVARMKQGLLRKPVWCQLNRCAGLPPSSSTTWTLSAERRRPQERLLSLSLHRAPGATSRL